MVERIVYEVVREGLSYYTADSGQRFERFLLDEIRLSASEAAKGRVYFAGGTNSEGDTVEARAPTLIHGYARTGGPFPCWAIVLGGEREVQTYLNEDALPLDSEGNRFFDPETGDVIDSKIRRVEYTFNLQVIADHPDVTLWYYHLLKYIVLRQHNSFLENDVEPPMISGADLAPDARYLPSDVFVRILTLQIQGEECWSEPIEGGFATTVSGIAVDDTTEGLTNGDATSSVTAGITTYSVTGS